MIGAVIALLVAGIAFAGLMLLITLSDRKQNAVLIQHLRKTGKKFATADPDYYRRIRATYTSRRVPQQVTRKLARFGL